MPRLQDSRAIAGDEKNCVKLSHTMGVSACFVGIFSCVLQCFLDFPYTTSFSTKNERLVSLFWDKCYVWYDPE